MAGAGGRVPAGLARRRKSCSGPETSTTRGSAKFGRAQDMQTSDVMKTGSHSPFGLQATILTGLVFALAGVLALAYPWPLVALCLSPMPVVLLLLWTASDVIAPVDRINEADAQAARARGAVEPRPAEPLAHAA